MHDWHISEAAYGEALGRLLDAHRAMLLAGLWGSGISSSSVGQQFHAGGRGAAISDINARNGDEPGVSFYTHILDQYDPFGSRVIAATAGEAPYVLDGLLYHQTGLSMVGDPIAHDHAAVYWDELLRLATSDPDRDRHRLGDAAQAVRLSAPERSGTGIA